MTQADSVDGSERKTVALALSSGGARGLAHVGAIQCLEAHGYQVRFVSGASMGALVGGVYAAGKLDEFAHWVTALRRADIVQLLDFGWGLGPGLFKGAKVIAVLQELVGDHDIEALPVGYTAVATELNRKREVWLTSGPLFEAIRASIAIPMVFSPVQRDKLLLVDGGVLNPLPIAPTLANPADLVVAMDVNGLDERALNVRMPLPPAEPDTRTGTDPGGDEPPDTFRAAIAGFMEDLFSASDPAPAQAERGMFDIATECMDAMQVTISRLKQSVYSPDLLVTIPRNVAHFFEFERAQELIDLGYERMEAALTAPDEA